MKADMKKITQKIEQVEGHVKQNESILDEQQQK